MVAVAVGVAVAVVVAVGFVVVVGVGFVVGFVVGVAVAVVVGVVVAVVVAVAVAVAVTVVVAVTVRVRVMNEKIKLIRKRFKDWPDVMLLCDLVELYESALYLINNYTITDPAEGPELRARAAMVYAGSKRTLAEGEKILNEIK